jgi:hypothetical protein
MFLLLSLSRLDLPLHSLPRGVSPADAASHFEANHEAGGSFATTLELALQEVRRYRGG